MINAQIVERTYESGLALIERGLAPFLLSRDDSGGKIPLRNCAACFTGACGGPPCDCLTCHGFYAATFDPARWLRIVEAAPGGYLAFATGLRGILVLDFEKLGLGHWLDFAISTDGAVGRLPETLTAVTPGGGVHAIFRAPDDGDPIASRNRILPYVDVKAAGGYVACPGGRREERRWLGCFREITPAPDDLTAFLRRRDVTTQQERGSVPMSAPDGYDFNRFMASGPPGGCREFFFNDLAYRLRRNGIAMESALMVARLRWEEAEQPPATRWFMPWRDVVYKFERVWRTVAPDVVEPELIALGRKITETAQQGKIPMSRVTIAGSDAS